MVCHDFIHPILQRELWPFVLALTKARDLQGGPGKQGQEQNSAPKSELIHCLQQQNSQANLVKIKA